MRAVYNASACSSRKTLAVLLACLLCLLMPFAAGAEAAAVPLMSITETANDQMTFAIEFNMADITEEQLAVYGSWLVDFEVKFNRDITLKADGTADGYLSGQLDAAGSGWVNIPSKERVLAAQEGLKTVECVLQQKGLSSLVKTTLKNAQSNMKTFNCGVYLAPEYMKANQGLIVTVQARLYNPEDAAQSLAMSDPYVYIVGSTPEEYFTYNVLNGTYCAVTGYTGTDGVVVIPSILDGYIVQEIAQEAFQNNAVMTKVTLPDTIEVVGNSAFANCKNLQEVVFAEGWKTNISAYAFRNCTALTSVTMPEGVVAIGNYAFDGCSSLPSVKMPDTVETIGVAAFRNCKALTDVQLGSGLTTIYSYAFEGCTALTAIQLPDSVIALGARAFRNCTGLAEVNFPKNWTRVLDSYYNSDTTYSDSSSEYSSPFEGCTSLTSIVIPEGVTAVPKHAFQNMDALTEIVLPSTIEKIGNRAFQDADGLATIVIPEGVTVIEDAAFQNANALANVTAPATLATLANYAFDDTALVNMDLSGTQLTTLNHRAFQNNKTLQTVKLPEGLTAINTHAFYNCPALTDVQLPSTLTTIYSYAFEGCTALTAIQLPDSVTTMSARAFRNCTGLAEVNFPKNWTRVLDSYYNSDTTYSDSSSEYSSPFEGCTSLTGIVVPECVTAIPKHAFQNMDALTSITLPSTLEKIGNRAFQDADGLATIVIPEGVTTIEEAAFQNANALANVTVPSTLETLANYAFDDTALVSIDLSATKMTQVNYGAFQDNKYLKTVKLPEGMTSIQRYAFYNCPALTDVQLPSTLTTIYSYAFENCTALKSITLPDGVTTMSARAFKNCTSLSSVNFPMNWTRVLDSYYNSDTTYGDSSSEYSSPFEGCPSLKNMEVPEGVTAIPKHAFRNAAALRTVILPDTLTAIGNYAFHNATALENLRMWENVGIIGDQSFTNVKNVTIYGKTGSYAETFAAEKGYEFIAGDLRLYFATTKLTFTLGGAPIAGVTVDFFDNTDKYLQDRVTAGDDGVLTYGDGIVGHEYTISWYHPDYDFAESAVTITLTSDGFAKKITGEKGLVIEETPAAEFTYTTLTGNNIAITGYTGSRTEIMIPGEIDGYNVLQLNDSAFKGNKTITKIKLPDTIETVGNYAFQNCTALTDFVAGSRLKHVPEGMFDACASLKTVKLGGSVTAIGRVAFRNCKALTDVQFGSGLTTIYSYAFEGCTALTAIQQPDSVIALGARAFRNCTGLAEVNFPKNWTRVLDSYYNSDTTYSDSSSEYSSPFEGCTSLTSIVVPEGVTAVPKHAFQNMDALTTITLPSTIEKIGNRAFQDADGLATIVIPEGVTVIEEAAFQNANALANVTAPATLTTLANYAFDDTGLVSIDLSATKLTTLNHRAFQNNKTLQTIKLPEGLTAINTYAFYNCTALNDVQLPSTLTTIYSYAFEGCTALTAIQLPDSVTTLGARAFRNCTGLAEVNFPMNWTRVLDSYYNSDTTYSDSSSEYSSPFEGCTSLTGIVVPEGVTAVPKHAFQNADALSNITLPSTLEKIGNRAFQDADSLATIVIPEGVTTIEEAAFQNANKLTAATMPSTLTTLANYAFDDTALVNMDLSGTKLTALNHRAFQNAKSLKSVKLPEGLTAINTYAFYNCTALTDVQLPSTLTTIYSYAFENCTALKIITLPDSVTTMSARAFKNCTGLSSVNFPMNWTRVLDSYYNSDTTYGDSSSEYSSPFEGCSSLKNMEVPEGVTSLPKHAFQNAAALRTVILPDTLTAIGNYAFHSATALENLRMWENVGIIGDQSFTNVKNVTIYGKAGSYAETFAAEKGYEFIAGDLRLYFATTKLTFTSGGAPIAGVTVDFFDNTDKYLQDRVTAGDDGVLTYGDGIVGHEYTISWYHPDYDFAESAVTITLTSDGFAKKITGEKGLVIEETPAAEFTYTVLTGNNIAITGYTGTRTEIMIPGEIDGYNVLQLNDSAFKGNKTITKVKLPDTIETVGNYAFQNCTALTDFVAGSRLKNVPEGMFDACSSLKTVKLGGSVTAIGRVAFRNCKALTDVQLGSGLTTIYSYAFEGCTALTAIQLPDSVTTMGARAFKNCSSLSSVNFPRNWTRVLDSYYNSDTTYSDSSNEYSSPFEGCSSLKNMEVPEGVTAIPKHAFQNADGLAEISLPSTLSSIGVYAFYDADGMRYIDFPAGLKTIGAYAFRYASNLSMLNLPEGLESIGNYAFADCVGLRNIYLNGLATVPDYAFFNCDGLVSVMLDEGTTVINQYAFADCGNLSAIYLPKEITALHKTTFNNCGKLVIYCYSGTVVHVTVEAAGWRFELLDNHEHDYVAYMDTEPSCLRGGSKMLICTICSYTYIELTDALGHEAPEEFTVTVEPGCLTEGYQEKRCTRCDLRLEGEVLPPVGHAWNDWVVEQQPTIFSWGLRWHDCSRCGAREEEPMAKLEVPEGDLDKYGYAYFRVVNANDKTPLMGAQITIKLNEDETLNMVTNAEGRAEHVLPVGSLRATVFMPGMMSRNITITVTNGECVIPDIGLSATDTIQGQLTVTEMTYQEILDAGIDVTHPDNQHVYKYAIELHFSPSIDILNIFYFMNGGGWNPFGEVFYTPDPDSDWERKTDANGRPYFFLPGGYGPGGGGPGGGGPGGGGGGGNNGGGGGMSVYPISEDFYLIIYGEVRWLKEMFDAELLVINTSQTDTLTNVQASLELPKGMSLATMVGDQQTSTINLGTIDCGQQKTAHWYLRGDEAGDYAISAHLTGTMQPFGEEINRTYKTSENIHVYAGNAMHLTYYVQDAAYYGVDYIVRAELENVSHKTLYNVSHLITGIKEGKITHYSDGSVKETVYLEKDGVIASNFAQYFHPGDKLVIELSIPIHFESEIIQRQLDQVKDCITMIENIANIMGFIDDVTSFMGDYEDFFDSVTSLTPDSGIGDRLETVKNGYTIAETLFGKDDEKDEVLSVWDSLRNVVQSIPVRFDLISAQVHVLEGSTTEIPTTIIPVHTPGSPWVVQLDKYLTSILITMFGDLVEVPDTGVGLVDFALENIVDIKGQIGYEEALAYRHAIDQQVQNILARVPGSEIGVRVWTEYGSLKVKPVAVASKTVGGVTSFNGSAYLEVTPNGKDDVLYVEVDGEVTSYPFDVVQAHTCKGTWKPLVFPTEKTRGLEALVCGTCGKALETRVTSTCGDHTFDGWQTDVEATEESLGIVTRMCTKCHVVEYRVVNEDGGVYNTVSFKANGGKGKMEDVPVPFDQPYTLPECTFTHDSLQFACWNTMADGTGESYAPGMEIELTNNITFYAIWTETGRMQYDMSGVQLSDTALPYNGQAHTVTITGLPEGVTLVSAEGLTATDMGEYTVTAVLATNDPFYETPALPALTWAIRPAISYAGEAEYTYNGKNPVADEFDLLVEEEPVLTYAALTTDGSGAEVVTSLTAAPVNAGKYRVTASVTFGEPAYTETVTADYAILPRDVTVAPASLVWEYNGEKAVNNRWTASGLISGDEVTGYAIQGGEILPGVYEEAYTISGVIITGKTGADVTGNYNVTCAPGKLTIVKRLVTVTADDVMAEYDGKPHGGTRYHAENLLAGHSVTGVTIPGTGIVAGNYVNWLLPEGGQVVDGEGNDLMHLYELQYKTGDMVIVPRSMIISVTGLGCTYRAEPVTNVGYKAIGLVEGHVVNVEITGEATVPGDYPGLFAPGEATVTDAAGEDVTVNYAISYKPGDLTILPAPLTVTAPSATHEYDGKDVTCDEYTFTGLVGGDILTGVTVEGTYRTPGTYDNAFTPVGMKIVAADGADVTACYAITVESGSLTIAPRALTIKADDRTVRYNGESHGGTTFTADRLAEGHSVASIVRTGSASAEGVHTDILKVSDAVITDETGADVTACYTITYKPGTLAIVTIEASDVAISADTLYLREGDKVRLVLTNRNGGGLPDMEWHSDSSAVTVNDNGVVTCHAAGSATITVSLKGMTDVMAACTVYADDMKQLSLPTMLAQVEEEAWMNNPALRVVDFSNAIEPVIGDRAFKDCGKLVKVLLPEATTIGEDAFDGCNSLVLYCTDKDAAAYAKAHGIPYVMLLQVGN